MVPEHRIPEVGARIMDLQDPTRKMSTTGGSEQGTVYVLDEPDAIEKKVKGAVTDSGSEIRRAPEKPGVSNLIEILAAVAGVEPPEAIEADIAGARYGELKARGRRRHGRLPRAGARALPAVASRRGGARVDPRATAPSTRARSPRRRSPTCASGWAWALPPGSSAATSAPGDTAADDRRRRPLRGEPMTSPRSSWTSRSSADRSTCCSRSCCARRSTCSSSQLAEVVLAYLDHLRGPRRAGPRVGDRVHRAGRRAAGAEVEADADRRGGRAARHRARAGRRGAPGADARRAPLPCRRRPPRRAARRASTACAFAPRRCPASLRRDDRPAGRGLPGSRGAGRGDRTAAARPRRRSDLRHIVAAARHGRRAPGAPARPAAARGVQLRARRSAAPTG